MQKVILMTSLLQDATKPHDIIMSIVLEAAGLLIVEFNPNELQYRVSGVKYIGQIISKSGIKADLSHKKAVVDIPTPKS